MASDWYHSHTSVNVELRLLSERTSSRQYNSPTIAEDAALITNDFGDGEPTRDIVVNKKDSGPKKILELHPSYMALQYPLLFLYGEDGFAQLWFFDTHNEIRNWLGAFMDNDTELRLLSERTSSRQYNSPTIAEDAALITNDFGDGEPTRDIVDPYVWPNYRALSVARTIQNVEVAKTKKMHWYCFLALTRREDCLQQVGYSTRAIEKQHMRHKAKHPLSEADATS
nr:AT hook motif-containing protein, putative [Tanacetum cinerariifolium]